MSTDPSKIKDITEGDSMIVDFTYSVKWKETTIPFEKRMEKYSRYSFLPQHLEVRRQPHLRRPSDAHLATAQPHICPAALVFEPITRRSS